MIYFADLPDMELAVSTAYDSIYANMGEVCNAGSRSMLKEQFVDFADQFIAEGQGAYTPGDPLDPETNMGPLMSAQAQKEYWASLNQKNEGETQICGNIPTGLESGCLLNQPCLQM